MTVKRIEQLAREIYDTLGTGHTESTYQGAMEIAMRLEGEHYEAQKVVPVLYKGMQAGYGIADVVLANIVIELKAARAIGPGDLAQVRCYMQALAIKRGMVINFGQPGTKDATFQIEFVSA
jgi:GxxExxY protein